MTARLNLAQLCQRPLQPQSTNTEMFEKETSSLYGVVRTCTCGSIDAETVRGTADQCDSSESQLANIHSLKYKH